MLSTRARCCAECRVYIEQPDAARPAELLSSFRYCVDEAPANVDQRIYLEPLYASHRAALAALNAHIEKLPHKTSSEVSSEKRPQN